MRNLFVVVFALICSPLFGQFNAVEREDELSELLDSLRAAKNDAQKMERNDAFQKLMATTLKEPTIFDLQFEKLETVGFISSPDGLVKIVNWNVEMDDESQRYFAYVLHKDPRTNEHEVFELKENPAMFDPKPTDFLESDNWYGALYYQIVPFEKNSKTSYIVLGWDGLTSRSNMKLIDVLTFTSKGVRLGQAAFKVGDETLKRVFFEHSETAVMSLRWEERYERIIFDHLSPETPTMAGFYEYYVPDMSYDAFVLKGSKWELKEDVIGVSETQANIKMGTKIDPKTGEVIMETVDAKWEDPTLGGAHGESEVHVAMLPEEEAKEKDPKSTASADSKTDKENLTALQRWEAKKRHKDKGSDNAIIQTPKRRK